MEDKSWKKWKMPEVHTNDKILFFKNTEANAVGVPAFVGKVYDRTVDATILMNGHALSRRALHHVDDPGLKLHADHWIEAGGGVFDFAESTKREHAAVKKLALIEERLAELTLIVDGLVNPDKPAEGNADKSAKRKPGRPRSKPAVESTEPELVDV